MYNYNRYCIILLLFIHRSSILLDLKMPQEALVTVQDGLKRNSSSAELYLNLGTAYLHLKERDKAKEALRNSVAVNPHYLISVKKLARLYSEDSQHEAAKPLYVLIIGVTVCPDHWCACMS